MLGAGLSVTAVDSSKEMLAHCPTNASLVLADIETLRLDTRFDAVILPTGLINHVDAEVREAFVKCAARHLRIGGRLFVQRQDPHWLATAVVSSGGRSGEISGAVHSVERTGKKVAMTLRWWTDNETWTQSFELLQLGEEDLQKLGSVTFNGSTKNKHGLASRLLRPMPNPRFERTHSIWLRRAVIPFCARRSQMERAAQPKR